MYDGWSVVIGLECHAQLACASKLFCACAVVQDAPPNVSVCPVCLAHPGTLPVLNAGAVALAVRAAVALSFTVHPTSGFDRKHYTYPDLPKGYQITQDEAPLATGGRLHVGDRAYTLTRLHLEEDAGRMIHTADGSLVDWNRAGVPLIEIVGAAELARPDEAEAWLRALHRVLVEAGVCLGDMEKGHFRCDANVSVHRPGEAWGTRVEIKNVNSFRFVARALRAEIDRQVGLLGAGLPVARETRTWNGHTTVPLRSKEEAADYRWMPEPDLPGLAVDAATLAAAVAALPGVPLDLHLARTDAARRAEWAARFGLDAADVEVLLANPEAEALFRAAVAAGGAPRGMANLVKSEGLRRMHEDGLGHIEGTHLVAAAAAIEAGRLNRDAVRRVLDVIAVEGGDVDAVAERLGLRSVGDEGALRAVVDDVVVRHPDELARYRSGNKGLQGFFIGQVMAATGRRADPKLAARLVREALEGTS